MPEDTAARTVILGASRPGVMPRNERPVVPFPDPLSRGSAGPWVDLAPLPPAMTWQLTAVTDSGGSGPVCRGWCSSLLQTARSLPAQALPQPSSSAPFSKCRVLSPYLLGQMQACREVVSPRPGPYLSAEGRWDSRCLHHVPGVELCRLPMQARLRPSRAWGGQIYEMKI